MHLKDQLAVSTSIAAAALLMTPPAQAAAAEDAPTQASASDSAGEIVVSARRKEELLQDVPQALSVVTAESISKLNITQFADIQGVVAGLTLSQDNSGTQSTASIRGISFDANTKASPTVAMYLDDVSVQSLFLFSSFYDTAQVEVLRGPQGTLRGVSAPSGAITVTTRKPDLDGFGGYANGTLTNHSSGNAQAAVNVPLMADVLAIRLAGMYDRNDANGVRSINNPKDPSQDTLAGRASLRFEPSTAFKLVLSYSHLDKRLHAYDQVSGPGQGTALAPAITPRQRLAVQDGISNVHTKQDFVTGQIDADLLGHHLTYNGSYQDSYIYSGLVADQGNILPGIELPYIIPSGKHDTTQELRIASIPGPDRPIDYVAGFYYAKSKAFGHVDLPGPLMPGAFGSPALAPSYAAYNPAYQVPLRTDFPYTLQETSIFGTVTVHLGPDTEISGGLRHIWSDYKDQTRISTGNGLIALPPAFIGGGLPNCAVANFGSTYPGFCDVPIPGGVIADRVFKSKEHPTIYNLAVSHRFSPDLMVYANTGTSFRPPVSAIGIQGALATTSDPLLMPLIIHPSEKSTSYEAGFKAGFLDGKGYLNLAVYHQKFRDMTLYVPNILYNNTQTGFPTLFNFTATVDAKVTGLDLDVGLKLSPSLNLSAQFNYADGKVDGSKVPCNITAAGAPVFNTGGLISMCPGGAASRSPKWNATIQGEYSRPVSNSTSAFLRGLFTYNPQNRNRAEPNFTVDSYGMLNLFAGLRSDDGAWEVSLFARNAFNARRMLDRSPVAYNVNTSLGQSFPSLMPASGSGYYATTMTPRRQAGINLRYAFGSR